MRNTAGVIGGKPLAVWSLSISDVSAVNLLIDFHDIHGRKEEVLFYSNVPKTTRDYLLSHFFFLTFFKFIICYLFIYYHIYLINVYKLTYTFQGGLTSGRRPVVKIIAESLSQHDEEHVVQTPLSGIKVGRRFDQRIQVDVAGLDLFWDKLYSQQHTRLYTLDLYRSYSKGINANIELQLYSEMCCWPYLFDLFGKGVHLFSDLLGNAYWSSGSGMMIRNDGVYYCL
jgi:hypothetical protein